MIILRVGECVGARLLCTYLTHTPLHPKRMIMLVGWLVVGYLSPFEDTSVHANNRSRHIKKIYI